MNQAVYYPKGADCKLCVDFLPGRELPELGQCKRFPALGPLDTDAAQPCRCLKFRPAKTPTCSSCRHYAAGPDPAEGSCHHPDPVGPKGPDGWPRAWIDYWCAGHVQADR